MTVEEEHAEFQASVRDSAKAVAFIAKWLKTLSPVRKATILANTIAPTRDKWAEHSDHGDIDLEITDTLTFHCEVKELKRHRFTAKQGHPFPNRVFIDSVDKYERKKPEPDFYFLLSGCWRAVVRVDCGTKRHWWEDMVEDPISGVMKLTYITRATRTEIFDLTNQ